MKPTPRRDAPSRHDAPHAGRVEWEMTQVARDRAYPGNWLHRERTTSPTRSAQSERSNEPGAEENPKREVRKVRRQRLPKTTIPRMQRPTPVAACTAGNEGAPVAAVDLEFQRVARENRFWARSGLVAGKPLIMPRHVTRPLDFPNMVDRRMDFRRARLTGNNRSAEHHPRHDRKDQAESRIGVERGQKAHWGARGYQLSQLSDGRDGRQ